MEIDLREDRAWIGVLLVTALLLTALTLLGRSLTPVDPPRLLSWQDWQVLLARRAHNAEISLLRQDVQEIARMAQRVPDPVAAQLLAARIARRASAGQPTLETARALTLLAAEGLTLWASGQMDLPVLVERIQQAEAALR